MVDLFSMGVQGRMWALNAHFVHGTFSQVSVVPICQNLGKTQVLPRAERSLRCSSTFLFMGLHGRCMLRVREFL